MYRTGVANLPLHSGRAPRWLFDRMKLLAKELSTVIVEEFGPAEFLRRLSDPYWFQSFGCVLGFDWHSSGVTTTVCGAIKEGLKGLEKDLGLYVCGGKGGTSRKTPVEIKDYAEKYNFDPTSLIYASKMSAKVDSAAVQDGYQLYHHTFIFTNGGLWTVVQQGMNEKTRYARRYHWLGEEVDDFVCEPHSGICSEIQENFVLNMVAQESEGAREMSVFLSHERPRRLIEDIKRAKELKFPSHHQVLIDDLDPERLSKIFLKTYEGCARDFETLLGMGGVGPKTIRALALLSELIYGARPSFKDPARYSFAHGGKDGHPYPVDRKTYDRSIEILRKAVKKAKLGNREKLEALHRLSEN